MRRQQGPSALERGALFGRDVLCCWLLVLHSFFFLINCLIAACLYTQVSSCGCLILILHILFFSSGTFSAISLNNFWYSKWILQYFPYMYMPLLPFLDRVLLCSLSWPQTQDFLPTSVSWMPEYRACRTIHVCQCSLQIHSVSFWHTWIPFFFPFSCLLLGLWLFGFHALLIVVDPTNKLILKSF